MSGQAASLASVEFLDPELLREAIRDSALTPCLLSGRPLPTWMGRLASPRLCLDLVALGPAMMISGEMSKGCYTMVYVAECPGEANSFNFGIRHAEGYLGFFPPGAVLDAATPEGNVTASLTVPVDEFHAAVARYFPEMPDRVLRHGAGMKVAAAERVALERLLAEVEQGIRTRRGVPGKLTGSAAVERDLLAAFFMALRSGCDALVPPPPPRVAERYRRMRQAREFIAGHLKEVIHLDDVGLEIGLSPRGTENLFKDLIGVNPVVFLRRQRLHGARWRLKESEPDRVTVKQVALEMGFRHLGRFAADYRVLFGESPRETLGRR
jgi:AraC-like DNA-binding protein